MWKGVDKLHHHEVDEKAGKYLEPLKYGRMPTKLRLQIGRVYQRAVATLQTQGGPAEHIASYVRHAVQDEYPRVEVPWMKDSIGQQLYRDVWSGKSDVHMLCDFFEHRPVDEVLTALQIAFLKMAKFAGAAMLPRVQGWIDEVNDRFLIARCGYQYEHGRIIRMDSTYVHSEIQLPALTLLADPRFEGPQGEFLEAHSQYLDGNFDGALVEANNAYESTMKVICELRGWTFNANWAARPLLQKLCTEGLFSSWDERHLNWVTDTLMLPTSSLRSKLAGHGDGSVHTPVTRRDARFGLDLAATKIVYLVRSFEALP